MADDRLRVRAMLADRSRFVMIEAEGARAVDATLSILAGMRTLAPVQPPAALPEPSRRKPKGGAK